MTMTEKLAIHKQIEAEDKAHRCGRKESIMEYITIYTNDLQGDTKTMQKAREALEAGNAVCIGSTCVGHTRAAMVELQGINFLRAEGCREVEAPERLRWAGRFFAK